jgi:hypothetical protein
VPTNKEIYNEVELDKVLCVRALAQEEQLIENIQKIQEIKLKKAKATTSGTYHCYKECDMLHWNLHYCYIPDSKLLSICCSIRHVVQNPVSTHCTCRPFLENVIFVLVKLIFFVTLEIVLPHLCFIFLRVSTIYVKELCLRMEE